MQELFKDDQEPNDRIIETAETGPKILRDEVRWALNSLKTGKAAGPDDITVEMLFALGEEGIDLVWQIVDRIYETGTLPNAMLKSIFVALPKIPGTIE